mgnify:FL=1
MTSFTQSEAAALPVRLSSPYARTIEVNPYDLSEPMVCEYEATEEEPAILWPTELAHPGSPAEVCLLVCKVAGVDLMDLLSGKQIERIESAILEALE